MRTAIEITRTDCPERVAGAVSSKAATDDFWADQPGQHGRRAPRSPPMHYNGRTVQPPLHPE